MSLINHIKSKAFSIGSMLKGAVKNVFNPTTFNIETAANSMEAATISLGTTVGSIGGRIYFPAAFAGVSRGAAAMFIPQVVSNSNIVNIGSALLLNASRRAAIEHIGHTAFNIGLAYGPFLGGVAGASVATVVNFAAKKATKTLWAYKNHINHSQGYYNLTNNTVVNDTQGISTIDLVDAENDTVIIRNNLSITNNASTLVNIP